MQYVCMYVIEREKLVFYLVIIFFKSKNLIGNLFTISTCIKISLFRRRRREWRREEGEKVVKMLSYSFVSDGLEN